MNHNEWQICISLEKKASNLKNVKLKYINYCNTVWIYCMDSKSTPSSGVCRQDVILPMKCIKFSSRSFPLLQCYREGSAALQYKCHRPRTTVGFFSNRTPRFVKRRTSYMSVGPRTEWLVLTITAQWSNLLLAVHHSCVVEKRGAAVAWTE